MDLAVTVFNICGLSGINKKSDDQQRQLEQILALHSYRNNPTECATDQNRQERLTEKTDDVARSEVTNEKDNLPAADIKPPPRTSLSDGSDSKSSPVKTVIGQGGHCIVNKIISRQTKDMTHVTSIDMHPAKPWIVTSHSGGFVSIWDYDQKQIVMEKQITKVAGSFANVKHKYFQFVKETAAPHWVCSVKFIAEEEWLAVGDGRGHTRVYTYKDTKLDKVDEFRAGHGESVDSLAVHPTKKHLLSSSAYGRKINLWDWSNGRWEKIHEFDIASTYPDGVLSLKFNPRETETFACVTDDERLQVGNTKSFSLTTKLKGQLFKAANYFCTHSRQNLMVTLRSTSPDAEILDLETGEVVGTIGVSGHETRRIAGHPKLAILVTALDDGTICFWDANTYRRLGEKVPITDSPVCHLALFTDINGIARLVVTFKSMISIMEINLPRANASGQTGGENYGWHDIP